MNLPQPIDTEDQMPFVECKPILGLPHGTQLTGFLARYQNIPWSRNPMGKIVVSRAAVLAVKSRANGNGKPSPSSAPPQGTTAPLVQPVSAIWVAWDGKPDFEKVVQECLAGRYYEGPWKPLWDAFMASENWKRKVAEKIRLQEHRCGILDCKVVPTQCHHWTYVRKFIEQPEDLTAFCKAHHELIHATEKKPEWFNDVLTVITNTHAMVATLLKEWTN